MTLDNLFNDISSWQTQFGHGSAKPALHHMKEEIEQELLGPGCDPHDPVELADLFILWAGAVKNAGHSLTQMKAFIAGKMNINKARTWQPADAQGVIRHVKDVQEAEAIAVLEGEGGVSREAN